MKSWYLDPVDETLEGLRSRLSPSARAALVEVENYCEEFGLALPAMLSGLRAVLHLAAAQRVPAFTSDGADIPLERIGEAIESVVLTPLLDDVDRVAIHQVLTTTNRPVRHVNTQLELDLAEALMERSVRPGERIAVHVVNSAPAAFERSLAHGRVYELASDLSGIPSVDLRCGLSLAVISRVPPFVGGDLDAQNFSVYRSKTLVSAVVDADTQEDVSAFRQEFGSDAGDPGDVILIPVHRQPEWPSLAAPVVELVEALGASARPSFAPAGALSSITARRRLDAMPLAPSHLLSRLHVFGIRSAHRLFNADGPVAYRTVVPTRDAVDTWRSLSAAAKDTGWFPIVLGSDDAVVSPSAIETAWTQQREIVRQAQVLPPHLPVRSDIHRASEPAEMLARARDFDPSRLLEGPNVYPDFRPSHGPWPESAEPAIHSEVLGGPWTHFALLPLTENWEAPAHLPCLSGEAYPSQVELVAVARVFFERYGAWVFAMSPNGRVEWWVPEPIASREVAVRVATELLWLAPDRDSECIEHLAARLLGARYWTCFWD